MPKNNAAITGPTATIEDNILIYRVPVNKVPTPSKKSGKTLIIASSNGNQPTTLQINGQTLYVGMNAYVYPPRES